MKSITLTLLSLALLASGCAEEVQGTASLSVAYGSQRTEWSSGAVVRDELGQARIYLADEAFSDCTHSSTRTVEILLPVQRADAEVLSIGSAELRGRFGFIEGESDMRHMGDAEAGEVVVTDLVWELDDSGRPVGNIEELSGTLSVTLRSGGLLEGEFTAVRCTD